MLKRVERKRKKQKEDEELGLDEEMKDIIGHNDTDSDESESDSDSDLDADSDNKNEQEHETEGIHNEDEEGGEDSGEEGAGEPPISVQSALEDPIYIVSGVRACMLCKGKLIKSNKMAIVHKGSIAHKRRFDRLKRAAQKVEPSSNAWDLLRSIKDADGPAAGGGLSKRAQKRQARFNAIKEIRQLRQFHKQLKAKARAEKKKASIPSTFEAFFAQRYKGRSF
ncbi:hypothetical protein BJ138DRAFT_1141241 [Hygrophoropsis aurantiaca]|uniref:Uncharacterized protein n=1 Tax=Hygrophoropsis aurantiaca TaxID=72124 RepID=A0ACB8AR09_9AGAM|nr:hypothetical protein BJ138DRAFT_1141241 [Hygrophoropsis aurantiaca]